MTTIREFLEDRLQGQLLESMQSLTEILQHAQSISAVAINEVPASHLLKYAGVIAKFEVARNGGVTFYDQESKAITHTVRCRSRSRRLIRRAARLEVGKCLVEAVMTYSGPVDYVECKTTIAR